MLFSHPSLPTLLPIPLHCCAPTAVPKEPPDPYLMLGALHTPDTQAGGMMMFITAISSGVTKDNVAHAQGCQLEG